MEEKLINKLYRRVRELEEENAKLKETLDAYGYIRSKEEDEQKKMEDELKMLEIYQGVLDLVKDIVNNPMNYINTNVVSINDIDNENLLDDSEFYKIEDPDLETIDDD